MLKNKLQILATLTFLGFVVWWVSFQHVVSNFGPSVQRFGYTYGLVALFGSIIGFLTAFKWGGHRTVLGRALLFFSFGLFAQEVGQLILTYYANIAKVEVPYPSWGDVAYFGSTLSYICGGIYLAKAVGVKFSLRTNKYKIIAFLVPAVLLIASFWVFLHHHEYDWHKPLTVFLDVGYPIGDAFYISMAVISYLLSMKMLGGVMRKGILILILALSAQYVSDWTFLYQTSRGTYVPGKYDDLFYLTAYFVTTTAMISFYLIYRNLRNTKPAQASAKST